MPAISPRRAVDLVEVTESDAAFAFEPVERRLVGLVIAVVVRDGKRDLLAGVILRGEQALAVLDPQRNRAADELSAALRISAPGSMPASVSTWKPLQMPITGTPRAAASLTARITGERAAIAPERR